MQPEQRVRSLKLNVLMLAAGIFLIQMSAKAADLEGRSEAQFSASISEGSILKKIAVEYNNEFSGPSVDSPAASLRPDHDKDEADSAWSTKNEFGAGYRLSEDINLSAVAVWKWQPVRDHTYEINDPYAKFSHESLISTRDLNLEGDLRLGIRFTTGRSRISRT